MPPVKLLEQFPYFSDGKNSEKLVLLHSKGIVTAYAFAQDIQEFGEKYPHVKFTSLTGQVRRYLHEDPELSSGVINRIEEHFVLLKTGKKLQPPVAKEQIGKRNSYNAPGLK